MSDVKRTLRVVGFLGLIECLFLQEFSEAKAETVDRRPSSGQISGDNGVLPHASPTGTGKSQGTTHEGSATGRPELPRYQQPPKDPERKISPLTPEKISLAITAKKQMSSSLPRNGKEPGPELLANTSLYIFNKRIPINEDFPEISEATATVRTRADGSISVLLPPGEYTILASSPNGKLVPPNVLLQGTRFYDTVKIPEKGTYEFKAEAELF